MFPDRQVAPVESAPAPGFPELSTIAVDHRTSTRRRWARRAEGLHLPQPEQESPMKAIVQDTYGSPAVVLRDGRDEGLHRRGLWEARAVHGPARAGSGL